MKYFSLKKVNEEKQEFGNKTWQKNMFSNITVSRPLSENMQNICIFENTWLYFYYCCYQVFWLHMVSSSVPVATSVFLPSTGVPVAQGEVCRARSTFRGHTYGQLPSFVLPFICSSKPSPCSLKPGKTTAHADARW